MSSRRFPGKVLAPFRGAPLIDAVVDCVREALPDAEALVLTSTERSDDPLAAHLQARRTPYFRGDLHDVLGRFAACAATHPSDWILRICADSPVLNAPLLQDVIASGRAAGANVDLVTTTAPRTFPKGQNPELIRASTLLSLAKNAELTAADREHVTQFVHRNPQRFGIENIESGRTDLAHMSLCVDSIEELEQLEQLSAADIERYRRTRYWRAA